MKLTVEQPTLVHNLTQVTSIVEGKNTYPILANVMLSAVEGKLNSRATDMDIEVTAACDATVETQGEITVNAATLIGIVKSLPKSSLVSLYLDDKHQLHIEAGKSKFQLATLPVSDFPVMASEEYDNTATIAAVDLLPVFAKTAFAMSTEETRYYLNGVYMHNDVDGNLCGVATDGHRLAIMTTELQEVVSPVIVPRKTVTELRKLLIDGDIELSTSASKVRFKNGDFTLVSKVVDGTFPDYTRIIPKNNDSVAVASAKALSAASARVTLVSSDKARGVKVALSDGVCVLSVNSQAGQAIDEVEIQYDGDPIEMGFNSKYISDAMSQAENGDVTLRFGKSDAPIVIEPNDVPGVLYVVMPMRVV
jgi:DNA polymerase-3 subunit beta